MAGPAAAYAFELIRDQRFLDGNKRIGFATVIVFLELNGRRVNATDADATLKTLALAAGALDESGYSKWLRQSSHHP